MKSLSKKLIPFALLAASTLLAACGDDPYQSSSAPDQESQNGQVSDSQGEVSENNSSIDVSVDPNIEDTISIMVPSGNAEETTMIQKAAETFGLLFPNVTVKINYVSISNYETAVRQQSMAGSLSDIVWTNSPEYLFLIKNNIAEPLNPYFAASTEAGEFNIDDYKTRFFEMGSQNGSYYVIPRSADTVVRFYNEELLTQAGIDMSAIKNGWTWDDFKNVCASWRAYQDGRGNTKEKGFICCDAYMSGWNSVSYPFFRSYGAEVIDEKGNCTLNADSTRAAITELRDLVDKGYIVKPGVDAGSSFETNSVPFLFQSASFAHYDDYQKIKGKINVVTLPLIEANNAPKIGAGIAGYSINSKIDANKKKLCWQFLRYILTKEGQESMAEGGLQVPPIRNDMDDFTKEKWGEGYEDKNLSAYTVFEEYKITDEFLSHAPVDKMNRLNLAYADFVTNALQGRKTIDQTIETAVRAINKELGK